MTKYNPLCLTVYVKCVLGNISHYVLILFSIALQATRNKTISTANIC